MLVKKEIGKPKLRQLLQDSSQKQHFNPVRAEQTITKIYEVKKKREKKEQHDIEGK